MRLTEKVNSNPFICKILFDTVGKSFPVSGSDLHQNFYDTQFEESNFKEIYSSIGKVKFTEESDKSKAGISYLQKLEIRFPNGDLKTSERISLLLKTKYLAIGLTNGNWIILGRNDFFQNTSPKIKTEKNEKIAGIRFTTKSIFSAGYTNLVGLDAFPYLIPEN